MRALIGPDLIRNLKARDVDIFDTKITGFSIRCRASGTHSFRFHVGRGHVKTIGRVGEVSPAEARTAAETLRGQLSTITLAQLSKDPKLNQRAALARTREELRRQRAGRRLSFEQFITEYEKLATGDMKTARETLRRLRRVWGAWFGRIKVDDISTFEIERWRASRRKDDVTPTTINRDLDALRAALNWGIRAGFLERNPAAGLRRVKADRTAPVRYLTEAEETRLRAALTARDEQRKAERVTANTWRRDRGYDEYPDYGRFTDHLHPFVLLALNSGARRGELFNLTWRDVSFTRKVMTLRGGGTKNGQTREIPLNREAVDVLTAWAPEPVKPEAYVFPGEDGDRMVTLKTAWTSLVKRAKLPSFRFHDCRHHFASRLVQSGVDLAIVRELLGHSDLKITLRYASLAPQHRADAVAKLVRG